MAGTGKKGYTGTTSDGKRIEGGIVQGGGSSSGPGGSSNYSSGSSGGGARVSSETYSNGQPKYVYSSSGNAIPTYGYRVVQGGRDGNLYDINNGVVRNINGGSYSAGTVIGGNSSGYDWNDDDGGGGSGSGGGRVGRYGVNGVSRVPEYTKSDTVTALQKKLEDLEGNKPAAYVNQYEGKISSILDSIMNRKAFDINTDINYQTLYDLYTQSYTQNASRAARDAMGQVAGLTGGYGSTYGQTVGTQQYDNIMQGMNDNNINLMNLAYGMYQDDRANDYNKLGAVTGLEASDYAKWLDQMGHYYTDLGHYTDRYNTENDREYNQYLNRWNQEYQLNRDAIEDARYDEELKYAREQAELQRELAAEALQYEREWNEDERDYNRSQTAFNNALSLAKSGYSPTDLQTSQLSGYPGAAGFVNSLAAQVAAANTPSSGSGSGSSSKSSAKRYDNSSSSNFLQKTGSTISDLLKKRS